MQKDVTKKSCLSDNERYADAEELITMRKYHGKEGKVDMCRGMKEWLEEDIMLIIDILEVIKSNPKADDSEVAGILLK